MGRGVFLYSGRGDGRVVDVRNISPINGHNIKNEKVLILSEYFSFLI
jgi:hypothetical protein